MAVSLNRAGVNLSRAERVLVEENWNIIESELIKSEAGNKLAELAKLASDDAQAKVDNAQQQINELVVSGDSSPQAIQASVGADGTSYDGNLKARLDTEFNITAGQLADKLDKGTTDLSLNNFNETDRAVIQGLEPGTINAVLGEGNVTPKNTSFFKTGKNLFNKETVLVDYYLRNTDGVPIASDGWYTSEFVKVNSLTTYTNSYAYRLAFYDENKSFISGLALVGASPRTFETPINTAFIRFDMNAASLDAFQLEMGDVKTGYESYRIFIPSNATEKHAFDVADIPDNSIGFEKVGADIATKIKAVNLVPNNNFESLAGWNALRSTGSVANGELTFTASQNLGQYFSLDLPIETGHIFYVAVKVKSTSNQVRLQFYNGASGSPFLEKSHSGSGNYELLSGTVTLSSATGRVRAIDYRSSGFDSVSVKEYVVVDLTKVYGAGKEPTVGVFEAMVKSQNGDNNYFTDVLLTNLINGELLNKPEVEGASSKPAFVSFKSDVLDVITKYNATQDLKVKMQKRGANNLFEFSDFSLIANSGENVSEDIAAGTTLFAVSSDFFAPYQLNALANIDGDYTGGTQFTGGNHAYDGGSTGSPTARTTGIQVYIEGRKVTDFSAHANFIDVYWTNRIQASNTKKADGTGREVLQENIHLHFDGYKWSVENKIELLEALKWQVYYGLQAQTSVWNDKIFYHNADNRKWNNAAAASVSTSKDCDKVTLYKGSNHLEIGMDLTGLGKKIFNTNNTDGAFVSSSGKVYFNLVNSGSTNLEAGDVFSFRGFYRFFDKA